MEEYFLNYEQSLAVKELGFVEEHTFAYYSSEDKRLIQGYSISTNEDEVDAPLKSQFFKWVRDKHGLYTHIFSKGDGAFVWCIRWYEDGEQKDIPYELVYNYEQAEDACINKIIELLKLK